MTIGMTNCSMCGGAAPSRTALCHLCDPHHPDYDKEWAERYQQKNLERFEAMFPPTPQNLTKGDEVTVRAFGAISKDLKGIVEHADDKTRTCSVTLSDGRMLLPINYDHIRKYA